MRGWPFIKIITSVCLSEERRVGHVSIREVKVEGHEVLDEAGAEAIAVVIDGLQGRHVIVAGSVDGN